MLKSQGQQQRKNEREMRDNAELYSVRNITYHQGIWMDDDGRERKKGSLRGIERVVAKDGLKAILTLRLAPVLPIPIGLYNYVYGVTNVPFFDFC